MKISMLFSVLCLFVFTSAGAASILDMSNDDMLHQASELRPKLNLTATQSLPWLQAESKTREVLREQKGRRERFQILLGEQMNKPQFDFDALAAQIDSEDVMALEERQRLRKIWLPVLKGLSETQCSQLREFLRALLDAHPMVAPASSLPTLGGDEQPKQRGGRGSRSGAMNGGMGGGMGGAKF